MFSKKRHGRRYDEREVVEHVAHSRKCRLLVLPLFPKPFGSGVRLCRISLETIAAPSEIPYRKVINKFGNWARGYINFIIFKSIGCLGNQLIEPRKNPP